MKNPGPVAERKRLFSHGKNTASVRQIFGLALINLLTWGSLSTSSFAASPVVWSATSSTGCPTQGQASDMTEIGGFVYILAGGGTGFYRFDPATEACTAMAAFPQSVNTNARLVAIDSDTIYGHYNSNVFRYDISENRWMAISRALLDDGTPVDNSGATQNNGNSIVAFNSALYTLVGNGTAFQSYDPSTNTWTTRAVTPAAVNDGGAMAVVGSNIYAFRGANTTNFWVYNGTSWSSTIAQAPDTVEAGGALAAVGNTVYAFRGNNSRDFWSYDTVGNTWNTSLADAPDYVFGGGALVTLGTNIYALQGNESRVFWKYDTVGGTWDTSVSELPIRIYGGGALTTDGTDIYAFTGNNTKLFFKYTVATNSWTRLDDIPLAMGCDRTCAEGGTTYLNNVVYAVTGDGISGLGSTGAGLLWRYPLTGVNANTWPFEERFSTPAAATYGAAMVHPGTSAQDPTGDFFYMLRSTATASFWKFTHAFQSFIPFHRSFTDATETALISQDPPVTVAQGSGSKIVEVNGEIYMIPAGNAATFVKYSPVTNQWTQLADTPDGLTESAAIVSTDNDTIWLTHSDDTFKYIISQNRWVAKANLGTNDSGTMYSVEASAAQGAGNRIVAANGKFFVAAGSGTTFLHFDPDSNVWTTLTAIPASASSGFSMIIIGTDIYALRGVATSTFYKYDINTNSWSTLTAIPSTTLPEEGADIAYPGTGDFIYALVGNNSSEFWRYSISGNSWTQLASTPANVQAGGALIILGNFAYALRGQNTANFWRYDITQTPGADAWNTGLDPTDAPAAVRAGGALTTDGTNLYATRGASTAAFWRYNVVGDSWTKLIDVPANMGSVSDVVAYGGLTYDSVSGDIFAVTGFGINTTPITPETGLLYRYKLSAGAGQNTWPYVEGIPFNPSSTFRGAGAAYPGTGNKFYLSTSSLFWDFDTNIEEWQTFDKAILPSGDPIRQDGVDHEGRSSSIVYNSANGLFYVVGGTSNAFQSYNPTTNAWTRLTDTPYPLGVIETDMMVDPTDSTKLLILNDAGNTLETEYWYSYDIPSDTWTTLETVPIDPGCANMAYPGAGDWIYISACQSPAHRHSTWRYSMSKELWVVYDRARFDGYVNGNPLTNPTPVAETDPDQSGGTTIVDANSKLYVLNGGTSFQEFDPSTNTWTVLTNPPVSVNRGALEWPGGEKLYAALDASQNLYSYCLAGSVGCTPGTWTVESASITGIGDDGGEPTTWASGADLYYPGAGDFIYAIIGRFSNDFFSYCFQNTGSGCTVGTWSKLAETPSSPGGFGGMASVDGNIIYALAGGITQGFWSYNIGTGGWTNLGNLAPATVNCGAALVEDGTYIYATRGNFTNDFWRYDPGGGGWSDAAVTDPPEEILFGDSTSGCHLGGITLIESTNEIWATSGHGRSPNSFFNYAPQGHLYRYKIATDEWPHYAAVVDNGLGQFRPTALASSGLDNFLYLQPGQYTTTFYRYTIADKSGTPDRTAADPGPGTWTALPSVPFAANGPLMKYVNGFIYLMRGNFTKNFLRFDFSETNSATLIGNEISSDSPATWATITDGTFTITIDGTPYDILGTGGTGIDFSSVTTMADVASIVQAAIRNETGSTETVTYCDDLGSFNDRGYFIFRSATAPGGGGSVSALGRYSALGTDISGVSVQGNPPVTLNGSTGQVRSETTSGDWEYCGATGQPDNIPVTIGDTSAGSRSGGMTYNSVDNELWVAHSSGDSGNVEGDNAGLLWRYDVTTNTWPYRPDVPDPPAAFNGGGDLTAHDADTLYALRGANVTDFFEFDILSNSWINLSSTAPAPGTVQAGGSLTSDGTTVYATRGNGTSDFWTFNPATNTWNDGGSPAQLPFIMGSASSTSLGKIDYANNIIWAASGLGDNGIVDNTDALLHRYNTITDEWPGITDPANPTAITDWRGGTDLTSIGGTDIYALRGRSITTDNNFFNYDISTDSWTTLATLPFPAATVQITEGGNLEAVDTDTIYALRGFATNTFYKYDVSGDTWSNDPTRDFPVNVGSTSEFADRGDLTFVSSENVLYGIPGSSTIVYELRLANRATIEQINGGVDPVEDTPFNVVVQASDTDGNPFNVTQDTQITLSLETGTGVLGGTLTGTILNGTSQITISGVTYSIPETGVQIRATDTSVSPTLESTVSAAFNVDAAPPTITTINPGTGTTMGGTTITIIGTNFQATPTVTFGGISASSVTFVNDTQITAVTPQTVPPATTGAVDVVVTNPDAQFDTELNGFTYSAPSVTSVVPSGGPAAGGNTVTVNGNYFGQPYLLQAVDIDNAGGALTDHQVEFSLNTADLITNGKMASDCSDLRVLDSDQSTPLPYWIEDGTCNTATTAIWTKVTLAVGPSTKTIYARYDGTASATTQNCQNVFEFCDDFSGTSVDAARWPTTQALEGNEISGGVLTLENGEGLFAGNYAMPSSTIIETSAAPGATNRIGGAVRASTTTGAGFVGDGGPNILDILWWVNSLYAETNTGETFFRSGVDTGFKTYFIEYRPGDVDTANFNYDNGTATTTRTGTNVGGTLFPVMYINSGTGNAQWDYVFVRKYASSQPTSTLSGGETSAGTTVEFELGNPSSSITYVDEQTLSVVVPSHAVGAVNVIVTNDDGLSGTLAGGYTYAAAPAVTSVNPNTGNNAETARTVTIGGADFVAGATARLEKTGETDLNCTNIQNFTSTSFDCDLNLSGATTGTWNVVVENPDAQTGTLADGFTVTLPPPTIVSIVPDNGPEAGGTSVTITGTNFVEGSFSRPVDITNSSASVLTNYQVALTLDTATPIGTGKMRSDCGDLRVKDTDGSTDIDYWIEPNTCNTASTRVYAEVPSIAATPATTTIYVTYGNAALTDASSIANTFIDELDTANLQGHWQMDETVENSCSGGQDGCDTSGNNRHGTAGTATTIATGKFNNGRNFNGTSSVAFDIPTISIPTDISAGAWVKTSTWSQSGFIIQKRVVNTQWELFLEGSQLKWRGGSTASVNCSTAGLTANTWYHMSATQQGTTARVYIDGVECSNGTVTAIGNGTGQLDIGRHDSGYYFNGDIDEAFVYDRVLTPTEINNLALNYGFSTPNYPGSILVRKWEPSPAPNLEAVSATVGAETGGLANITFDGISATNIVFVNSSTLTADTPAHAAGQVDVVVTNPDSQFATLSSGFTYLGAPDANTSTFTASAASVVANGVTESILTATVKDSASSPLEGEAVSVALTAGFGSPLIKAVNCAQADVGSVTKGTTNASGQACFTVRSTTVTTPSNDTFTATITSGPTVITQTADVEFTIDLPDQDDSTFISAPGQVTADGVSASTLTATVIDSLTRAIVGQTVNVSDNSGGNVTYNPVSQSEATSVTGVADFDVTSTTAGTFDFTASLTTQHYVKNSYTETASPTFVNDFEGTAATLVPGSQGDNVEAATTLPFDFELYGTNVTTGNNIYVCSNGFISLASSGCPASGSLTNAVSGFFRDLTTTSGGIYRQVASDSNSVRFLWDAADVGSSNPVQFEIILTRSNRVEFHYFVNSGLTGRIGLYDGTASAAPDNASTFDNSVFSSSSASKYETDIVAGAFNLTQVPQVEFQAGAVDAGNSTVEAFPTSVEADGTTNSTITVTLLDAFNNPVAGQTVQLSDDQPAGQVNYVGYPAPPPYPSDTSDANGQVFFTVNSTAIDTVTFTADDITGVPFTIGTTQVEFTCILDPNQQCVQVNIQPSPGVLTVTAPDDFAFPGAQSSTTTQDIFSIDSLTPYTLNTNDVVIVTDTENSGGFTLQLQSSVFADPALCDPPGPACDQIPLTGFYGVTQASSTGGQQISGVEYDSGYAGVTNITAPQNNDTSGPLDDASTFTTNGDNLDAIIDLMLAPVTIAEVGRNGQFKENVQYYLQLPAFQPLGSYQVTLTFDLTRTAPI